MNLEGVVESKTGTWNVFIKKVIGPWVAAIIKKTDTMAANFVNGSRQNLKIAHAENISGMTPKYGVKSP